MKRVLVFLAALAFFVLLAEGLQSWFFGTSLRRLGRERTLLEKLAAQDPALDRERFLAALHTVGPYRVPEDPLVGITLKAEADLDYIDQRFRTDALGLRPRAGPPVSDGAFHVVFLGDSVAYGDGVAASENIAAQLEEVLRAVSPPDARAVVCSSVAVPGWNYRNSTRHLLDHLDRIAPDLVLFVPVENDLNDGYCVTEAGQRRFGGDPGVPRPLCPFQPPLDAFRNLGIEKLGPRGLMRRVKEEGLELWFLVAGLTESARWRLDDMTASVASLDTRLRRVGARLVLVPYAQHDLHRMIRARLVERGTDLPVVPLLERYLREDQLGKNEHPSLETLRAMAIWIAGGLAEQHLLPFALARPLPEVPARLADRRGRELAPEELRAWRVAYERDHAAALVARIEPTELDGLFQVYGGVNADGTLGIEAALVLPAGRRLRVVLAGVGDSPGLYPLGVGIEVDGRALGDVVLTGAGQETTAELPLEDGGSTTAFEVRLVARDWVLGRVLDRRTPVSARLVRIESLP